MLLPWFLNVVEADERRRSREARDIPLAPPTVKSGETVAAVEDRTYLAFIVSAAFLAIGAGFLLAVVIPLASAGVVPGADRIAWLIQAHAWAQLQGWAGLFVAGMAIRIIPRFAGRHPIRGRLTVPVLFALLGSVILRTVVQPWATGDWGDALILGAGILGGLGMAGVTVVLAVTLARARRRGNPWEAFAWAGTAWWGAWAAFTVAASSRTGDNLGLTPFFMNDAMTWMVMLGAVGNFIWAVQSRSVPVFFGRRPPSVRTIIAPLVLLNLGTAAVMLSLAEWGATVSARIEGTGLALAGLATVILAPLCGSVWGTATRLRPRARSASRFVIAANQSAVVGGLLLLLAGSGTILDGEFAWIGARDAARHAFGVGLITMLILGMAQLIAPVFAMSRAEARGPSITERLPFWLLVGSVALRVGAGLLRGRFDIEMLHHTTALAGVMAWVALVMFALTVIEAIRREPEMKALLSRAVSR